MTALLQSRGSSVKSIERLLMLLEVGAKVWKGGIALVNANGNVVQGQAGPGYVRVGTFYEDKDNSAGTSTIAVNVELDQEIFARWFVNDTTAPVKQTDMLKDCYVLDDQTVTADSINSPAGRVWGIDTIQGVLVQCTYGQNPPDEEVFALVHQARAVITSIAAYTAAGGVLTANANGAIGAQDGVTLAAGDVVFLPTDKAAAPADAGPYIATAVGGASAKFVLTRPNWFRTGSHQPSGQMITLGGEGTLWQGSEWKSLVAASTFVVDTTDGAFYPRCQTSATSVAMTAGVLGTPITACYVSPNAQVTPIWVVKGGTPGSLQTSTQTPGKPGVSSLVATSTSNTDTSTVKFLIENF